MVINPGTTGVSKNKIRAWNWNNHLTGNTSYTQLNWWLNGLVWEWKCCQYNLSFVEVPEKIWFSTIKIKPEQKNYKWHTHQHRGCWSRIRGWQTCWPAGQACCQTQHDQPKGQLEHPPSNKKKKKKWKSDRSYEEIILYIFILFSCFILDSRFRCSKKHFLLDHE